MPKPDIFAEKKRKILQELNKPDEDYADLSPIGAVDPNIRQLVHHINRTDGLVTTSSCAGRISVFLEGAPKLINGNKDDEDSVQSQGKTTSSSRQGKGGGKWLYVSHDPVEMSKVQEEGALLELFSLPKQEEGEISFPAPDEQHVRFVHFKFEPMILHILTSSLTHAQHCHSAAMSAGFRESGIAGITGPNPTPHVGIRTQGLALESLIAYQDPISGKLHSMVTESYLRTLLHVANQRFVANRERKARFERNLFSLLLKRKEGGGEEGVEHGDGGEGASSSTTSNHGWEPSDVRRERKRAEGLRRRDELQQQRQQGDMDGGDGVTTKTTTMADYWNGL